MKPGWIPPQLNSWEKPLIQEKYWPDRWKMLICCLMLNLTSYKQVLPVADIFFEKWPDPKTASKADEKEMKELLKTLGMNNKRSKTIIRFSKQFLEGFDHIKQLHGCGKYAADFDAIFFEGRWQQIQPTDSALKRYIGFLNNISNSSKKS